MREEPALRKQRLLERSAELRQRFGREAAPLTAPIALADQAIAGARWLRQHPEWPLGALVVLVVLRPRRALRWAARGWWIWQAARRLLRAASLAAPHAGSSDGRTQRL